MRGERFEIDLNATPEQVWEMLTTADGIASWFGTDATIELAIGGERTVRWGDAMEFSGEITELAPTSRIRVSYVADGVETGAEDWLITSDGTTTRLTLINSMSDADIDDWDGFYGDIRRGWRLFLASMKYALETAETTSRLVGCSYLPASASRQNIWDGVEKALEFNHSLIEGMDCIISDEPHSRLYVGNDRSLLLDVEGAGDAQVLFAQAASHAGEDEWIDEALAVAASSV